MHNQSGSGINNAGTVGAESVNGLADGLVVSSGESSRFGECHFGIPFDWAFADHPILFFIAPNPVFAGVISALILAVILIEGAFLVKWFPVACHGRVAAPIDTVVVVEISEHVEVSISPSPFSEFFVGCHHPGIFVIESITTILNFPTYAAINEGAFEISEIANVIFKPSCGVWIKWINIHEIIPWASVVSIETVFKRFIDQLSLVVLVPERQVLDFVPLELALLIVLLTLTF